MQQLSYDWSYPHPQTSFSHYRCSHHHQFLGRVSAILLKSGSVSNKADHSSPWWDFRMKWHCCFSWSLCCRLIKRKKAKPWTKCVANRKWEVVNSCTKHLHVAWSQMFQKKAPPCLWPRRRMEWRRRERGFHQHRWCGLDGLPDHHHHHLRHCTLMVG